MTTDLTFITNENGQSLKDRFNVLIKDARFFDVLSGYFYASGFYAIYRSLESTEKIRVLVGISTDRKAVEMFQSAREEQQLELTNPSFKEAKDIEYSSFPRSRRSKYCPLPTRLRFSIPGLACGTPVHA